MIKVNDTLPQIQDKARELHRVTALALKGADLTVDTVDARAEDANSLTWVLQRQLNEAAGIAQELSRMLEEDSRVPVVLGADGSRPVVRYKVDPNAEEDADWTGKIAGIFDGKEYVGYVPAIHVYGTWLAGPDDSSSSYVQAAPAQLRRTESGAELVLKKDVDQHGDDAAEPLRPLRYCYAVASFYRTRGPRE